jgi:2-oxoglutarate dehydrogenase E1 component
MSDPMTPDLYQTMNAGFVQAMYEEYLRDPASVDAEWRALFENGGKGLEPVVTEKPAIGNRQSAIENTAPIPDSRFPIPGISQPMRGAAAKLVANMTASLAVPTATSFRDVAVGTLDARRKALNAAIAPKKVSYTHLIAWALVQAAKQHPVMTHAFAEIDGAPHRLVPDGINLGLAVDVEKKDGSRTLMVPVIKRAEVMDFAAFHAAYESLVERARANQLMPDDFKGATMTLTNPGTIGTVASVPRLMAGQGSIIATGAIRDVGGTRIMTITSTYDHRVIQGAESGVFLRTVDSLLQGQEGFYEKAAMGNGELPMGSAQEVGVGTQSPFPIPHSPFPASSDLKSVAAAMALVRAHRLHGHALAQLDPLGSAPPGDPACDPDWLGLTAEAMTRVPADVLRVYVPGATMAEVLPALRTVYCGTITYEFEHIASHEERVWLRQQVETGQNRRPIPAAGKHKLLGRLTAVESLERFLHKAYLGQKRFSIEGLDISVPMLDLCIELAGEQGTRDVVIGMAHRGRLNVLAHVVNLPYESILGEFEGHGAGSGMRPEGGTGDVKYHHGAEGLFETPSGRRVTVTLLPNPSHLEAVNPVVEGRARAEQTRREGGGAEHDMDVAVPVLLHGDAAFSGQGIVAETFNLARLKGYATGGTIHIITNNQVGFTTDPKEGRSTDYSSDLAKGFDAPIVHVNADDPEACLAAVQLAMAYRSRYHNDVVLDVVGYRRWGHNEGDEPSYTQPVMYEKIRAHPTVRQLYAEQLTREGILDVAQGDALVAEALQRLADAQAAVKRRLTGQAPREEPSRTRGAPAVEPVTAVPAERLRAINEQLLAVPDGFTINAKLKKQLERRLDAVGPSGGIEWAHAEQLAYASLLAEGVPVRFTGQDVERGTFSQRHLVLHDAHDGRRWAPIQHLSGARASMELHNSPLSEYACVGFEYGYAVAAPETLVLWEAQFGDFVNGAEIIVDQFIIAGLAKWGQVSRLTLLLPHGYEGQGPEHSSARIERFVALGAEDNIRVANCSTPAQVFHLLRRQALHEELRPLIVFTPKSLLRLPLATSRLEDLAGGAFQPVLDDAGVEGRRGDIRRLLLCSGKVYYDLIASPARAAATSVAVARVEMLYPLPVSAIGALIAKYPNLKELVWVQEEPRNMGARKFILPDLHRLAPAGVTVTETSRPERASPAEGYPAAHAAEQARIVREAIEG